MRWTLPTLDDPRASARRIGIYVAVLGVHVLLLLGVLQDLQQSSRVKSRHRAGERRGMLQIRLIRQPAVPPAPLLQRALAPPARQPLVTGKRRALAVRTPAIAQPAPKDATPQPATAPAVNRASGDQSGANYIPGGTLFSDSDEPHPGRVQLPGSGIAVVPGLHMADPRSQGVAGLVRGLKGLFGVVNPQCYDVDAWRRMSLRELLAHHLTPERVAKTAAEYNCGSARASHTKDLAEPLRNAYDAAPPNQ